MRMPAIANVAIVSGTPVVSHVPHMTHSYGRYDSFIYEHMTHSYGKDDSFIYATMTHSYRKHDSFIHEDMTHSHV